MNCTIPSQTPSFPSLYNPLLEKWTEQCNQDPRVVFLYHSGGVHAGCFPRGYVRLTPHIIRHLPIYSLLDHTHLSLSIRLTRPVGAFCPSSSSASRHSQQRWNSPSSHTFHPEVSS